LPAFFSSSRAFERACASEPAVTLSQAPLPKQHLVSTLEARLHSGELKIAAALTESPILKNELQDFARKVSESGRVTFSARSGTHDDLILSICVALHVAATPRPSCGVYELKI
jgi:hypothetical protein